MGTLPIVRKTIHQLPESSELVEWYAQLMWKYYGLEMTVSRQLVKNYGVRAFQILALIDLNPELKDKLYDHPQCRHIKAEVVYQIRHEMVQNAADVLLRRIPLAFTDQNHMKSAIINVINLFAQELKWD